MAKNASNCPPWLEKILKFVILKVAKYVHKLSTMSGENFGQTQVDKYALKLSTMLGENVEIC